MSSSFLLLGTLPHELVHFPGLPRVQASIEGLLYTVGGSKLIPGVG